MSWLRQQVNRDSDFPLCSTIHIGVPLPTTYKKWLREQANGAFFDRGSTLRLFSLDKIDGEPFSVLSQTEYFRNMEHCELKELVVFGCNGVDGEKYSTCAAHFKKIKLNIEIIPNKQ
ncbi:SMI1/KNR4 family protein [Brevibacillus sp. B_LB10_24]|uniref:SMI1/KNR4 family protein n=1 Tax=Brevibacillus sp. B_LB10_24 TaxID=3380645 RepID=UPI0038B8ADA3